jgi:hypothetical protein
LFTLDAVVAAAVVGGVLVSCPPTNIREKNGEMWLSGM